MTFKEACDLDPNYKAILDQINFIASLERPLTPDEERELTRLHSEDEKYRKKFNLI